jgi:hypothetical protein
MLKADPLLLEEHPVRSKPVSDADSLVISSAIVPIHLNLVGSTVLKGLVATARDSIATQSAATGMSDDQESTGAPDKTWPLHLHLQQLWQVQQRLKHPTLLSKKQPGKSWNAMLAERLDLWRKTRMKHQERRLPKDAVAAPRKLMKMRMINPAEVVAVDLRTTTTMLKAILAPCAMTVMSARRLVKQRKTRRRRKPLVRLLDK